MDWGWTDLDDGARALGADALVGLLVSLSFLLHFSDQLLLPVVHLTPIEVWPDGLYVHTVHELFHCFEESLCSIHPLPQPNLKKTSLPHAQFCFGIQRTDSGRAKIRSHCKAALTLPVSG